MQPSPIAPASRPATTRRRISALLLGPRDLALVRPLALLGLPHRGGLQDRPGLNPFWAHRVLGAVPGEEDRPAVGDHRVERALVELPHLAPGDRVERRGG